MYEPDFLCPRLKGKVLWLARKWMIKFMSLSNDDDDVSDDKASVSDYVDVLIAEKKS